MHGSDYVNEDYVGRSWGCFTVDKKHSKKIIDLIKGGAIIFVYTGDEK